MWSVKWAMLSAKCGVPSVMLKVWSVVVIEYANMANKNNSVQTAKEMECVNLEKNHTTLDAEQLATENLMAFVPTAL